MTASKLYAIKLRAFHFCVDGMPSDGELAYRATFRELCTFQ
ncbi:Uncharacterised protein [Vibrio cholerae]|nr:Uncharacterised protein [Vibrio cholerae]